MNCLCRPSRIMSVRINLLDETDFIHEIKDDLPGQALLDVVFARLNLIETTYFGIRYIDEENQTHWLDPASRISRQLKPKPDPYDLYFGVKFYAADPCKLLEEITRYQLFLQVKQDVLQGRLPVAFELAAELGAFVVQSELGDYDQRRHSKGYVSEFRLLPNQSNELEIRVAELHQQLKGMSPAAAELNYLDKVKWHEMYGVDLHPVLGEDSVEYFLGLTPSGIVVLRNKTTVAHYYWPRIAKVYYKGRYFMLRISDKNNELSTYGFETPRKSACKHLWRCCVEHHAFFRSLRTAPLPTSPSNTSDLFQLGTRLKYGNSGRSEKQSAKDALSIGRTPPAFTRVPSKRQPRRVIDDFLNGGKNGNVTAALDKTATMTTKYESPYRSTYSIPTSLGIRPYQQQTPYSQNCNSYSNSNGGVGGGGGGSSNLQTPDSPRSTRSAPWPRSQQRSLFGHKPSSPRSVRSASMTGGGHHHHHHHHRQPHQPQQQSGDQQQQQQRYRSSSVESHSSNDSRSTRRHKHRHRRTSDNESELSRGSARSGPSHHRKHRRSRHRRDSGGSEHDSSRGRSYSGHRSSSARSGSAELIDSTSQWREVQRRQAEGSLGQSSVQQASVSKSSMVARSLHSNDSHSDTHSHHRSRRHRKNKSPSESRNRIWSSELAKHLQFDLVDTTGMTEDQLREIPYTVVETNSKRSNSNLKIHKSNSKNSVGGKSNGSGNTITNGSGSNNGQGKNRVDRIRGLYFQNSHPNESTATKNGSIRSASTISSRECERNNGLVRMMSSISMGDFISPTGSNLSPLENSALRVSHEHTDSGLGADQDYAYSSERSSDSTRYGTNQSSGASSGSHRKSTYNSLMQQTVSNQQQLQQQQQQAPTQRQNSFYPQRPPAQTQVQKPNYPKVNHPNNTGSGTKALAPIHNPHPGSNSNANPPSATNTTNCNSNPTNSASASGNGNGHALDSGNNRLLNYTTFENNQYKFSLNNVFGKGRTGGIGGGNSFSTNSPRDKFVEWPNTPAAPYYYQGPSSTHAIAKRRDAKSDIGVPVRRLSGQAITKTQLLTGQLPNASCYPMPHAYTSIGLDSRLHPAKSDLFLSYMQSSSLGAAEYERPYIYNYKMPQMPEFLRPLGAGSTPQRQQQPQPPQQANTAYHISGAQAADPPQLYKPNSGNGSGLLYAGAAPATDVMYYQFDNGQPPIVQQPKTAASGVVGPLVYLQHGQSVAPNNAASTQKTCTNTSTITTNSTTTTNTTNNKSSSHPHSPSSEGDIDEADEEHFTEDQHADGEDGEEECDDHASMPYADEDVQTDAEFMVNDDVAGTPVTPNNNSGKQPTLPNRTTTNSAFDNINLDNCNANANVNVNANETNTSSVCTNQSPCTQAMSPNNNPSNTFNRSLKPLQQQQQIQQQQQPAQQPNQNYNQNSIPIQTNSSHSNSNSHTNSNRLQNSHSLQNQNPNISSSLEIILSPIIQSSRRAQ